MKFIFRNILSRIFVLSILSPINAQIPKLGVSDRLDLATWNLEWFGSASNGPNNDELQLQYVTDLLQTLNLDIIGVQEISDLTYWNKLLFNLSDYRGILSTWSQTQKTGLIFKKSAFEFLYQKHILANYDYDFGGGRLPLEIGLIPTHPLWPVGDTLRIWVLHMKANTGSSSQKVLAYNRRYNAGVALKMYIDKLGSRNKGVILGDWNDDFDQSILTGYATPYQNWIKDTQYMVNSYQLSLAKQRSTVSYSDMIDHIVSTPGIKPQLLKDSTMVLYSDKWISNYGNLVSDHFPVYSRYTWNQPLSLNTKNLNKNTVRISSTKSGIQFLSEKDGKNFGDMEIVIYDIKGGFYLRTCGSDIISLPMDCWFLFEIQDSNNRQTSIGMLLLNADGTVSWR